VERCHSIFKSALRQAVEDERLVKNPADKAEPPRPQRNEMVVPTEEQSARLLTAAIAPSRNMRLYLPILLLEPKALRRNEALWLRWQDIDQEGGLLTANQTLFQLPGGVYVKLSTKNEPSRCTTKLPPVAVEALRQHREAHLARRQELGESTGIRDSFSSAAMARRSVRRPSATR
jgi:integrase